jgi:hypothetical protein
MLHATFKNTDSPFQTNRDRSTSVRQATGKCCKCGCGGDCKGLDVYAAVAYCIDNTRNYLGKSYWSRYLGMFEALFCDKCVSRTLIEDRKRYHRYRAKTLTIIAACLAIAFIAFFLFNILPAFWLVVLALACIGVIIAAGRHYLKSARPKELEMSLYIDAAGQYVSDHRSELLTMCHIGGLFWCNQYTNGEPYYATQEHIVFVIEPGRTTCVDEDFEKTNWMTISAFNGGGITYAKGEGVLTRTWR